MVKTVVKKINEKRTQIAKYIAKEIKTPSQALKDCNARLLTEPDNLKVQGWRKDALNQLEEGIKSLPYPLGKLGGLIEELEGELNTKPTKNTPQMVQYVTDMKELCRVWRELYERKKAICDDAETDGLIERVMF